MSKKTITLLTSMLLFILMALPGCTDPEKEQSMFRGNLQHTGFYNTKGPEQFHGVKWKFQTKDHVRTSPVIFNKVIYFGSDDHNFYAIDESTGTQKWMFKTEGAIKSSAAISNNTVYFYSSDGNLYALDAAKGNMKWSYKTRGKDEARDHVDYWQSSPAVYDGTVYWGGGESTFYAVDAKTGQLKWSQKLSLNGYTYNDITPFLHSSPAVDNGIVYEGLQGYDLQMRVEPGNVVALDAKTGKQIWISPLLNAVDSSPTLDDLAVYIGMRNGGVVGLDRKTGNPLWTATPAPYVLASPAIYKGTLYSGSSDSHILLALDAASGDEKWEFETVGPVHSSPATDGRTVYAACGNHSTDENLGIVYAVDAQTGKEKWKYQTGGNIYSSPALDHGVVFIGNDDGNLYALY